MNKPDLKLGRELAEKSTQGEWEHHNWDVMERPHVVAHSLWNGKDSCNGHFDVPCTAENTAHIAHHSGQTMIQIYNYIEELEDWRSISSEAFEIRKLQLDISRLEAQNVEKDKIIKELEKRNKAQVQLTAEFDNRIGELQDQISYLESGLVHTCHENCEKPICVKFREKDKRIEELEEFKSMKEIISLRSKISSLEAQNKVMEEALTCAQDANNSIRSRVALVEPHYTRSSEAKAKIEYALSQVEEMRGGK